MENGGVEGAVTVTRGWGCVRAGEGGGEDGGDGGDGGDGEEA